MRTYRECGVCLVGAVLGMILAAPPMRAQWTCTGGSCSTSGAVGIGTSSAPFPLTLSTAADRVLNFRGDPASFGFPSTLGGPIIQSVNSAQNVEVPMTFSASSFSLMSGNVGMGTTNPLASLHIERNVTIGTPNPQHLLHVAGTIGAEEIIVSSTGADYVFDPGYHLRPPDEVARYIEANHHLPDIPSADEVKQKGMDVGEMEAKLLAKIEELTLHMIDANDRINGLQRDNQELRQQIQILRGRRPQ